MALLEVNFFSKALMRPVTMNVILPADKVFFEEETEEDNKPFKNFIFASRSNGKLYRLGNGNMYQEMGGGEKSGSCDAIRSKYVLYGSSEYERKL